MENHGKVFGHKNDGDFRGVYRLHSDKSIEVSEQDTLEIVTELYYNDNSDDNDDSEAEQWQNMRKAPLWS
jgi:hypothetical protein